MVENAPRVFFGRALDRVENDALHRTTPGIVSIQIRFDAVCDDMRRIINRTKCEGKDHELSHLLVYCLEKLTIISRL